MRNEKLIDTCPMNGVINIIGKKWSILIIAVLGNSKKMRFNEIMNELKGITPKTLADTLKQFQSFGIVYKKQFNETPPRVEYSLTRDGEKLRNSIVPVVEWAVDRSSNKDCIILNSVLKNKRGLK
ncbi:MAG: helix-turn-helix transcriptional regulator [Candidatus Micrarchaeota archaeon]|nr:helix-turn-helix transcriptional regulator [Candidatus Micrarchaeota archaeon]MDE1848006.1 helix-turn-helix transcriptional regulator [Candidatus Micrarchaeota archaeon]MDE1864710.1 helix-turn-helix transcriptional regulator [Candidatus Micrarchaeota archaeon]